MAQQEKVLAAKTEGLSVISRRHITEREDGCLKVVLWPPVVV